MSEEVNVGMCSGLISWYTHGVQRVNVKFPGVIEQVA